MKLYNVTEIKAEDFPEELRPAMARLGNILNPFMQQVVELADGRIDFENTVNNIKTIELTVDANGVPTLNNKFQAGKTSIRGFQVISATNVTNATSPATEQPFITDYRLLGGGLVQINKITGLVANNNYRLNIVIY